mgnify:CR=1 FL=1
MWGELCLAGAWCSEGKWRLAGDEGGVVSVSAGIWYAGGRSVGNPASYQSQYPYICNHYSIMKESTNNHPTISCKNHRWILQLVVYNRDSRNNQNQERSGKIWQIFYRYLIWETTMKYWKIVIKGSLYIWLRMAKDALWLWILKIMSVTVQKKTFDEAAGSRRGGKRRWRMVGSGWIKSHCGGVKC